MIGNKKFSLEFLNRVFKSKPGFRVAPYRVYSSAEEFREEHFPPKTPRLLIRTNLDLPNVPRSAYVSLPRTDSTLESAQKDLRGLNAEWRELVQEHELLMGLDEHLEFIVHPTQKREDFLFHGIIVFLPSEGIPIPFIVFDKEMSVYSIPDSGQLPLTHKAKILKFLSSIKVPPKHADNLHALFLKAFKEITSKGKQENLITKNSSFTAKFTLLKSELEKKPKDAKLEFYDFQYS